VYCTKLSHLKPSWLDSLDSVNGPVADPSK